MPSVQNGSVRKRLRSWQASWYDDGEPPVRRFRGGFATKSEARVWVNRKVEEVSALRQGGGDVLPAGDRARTVDALLDTFLEKHGRTVDAATKRKLTSQLKKARAEFGDRRPDSLRRIELEDWRELLPAGSRHDVFRAFRQALAWGLARGHVTRDPSAAIKNPKRKRHERRPVLPFETWDDVLELSGHLGVRYRAIPVLAVGCGLRPEELFGLHRDDVDREARVLHVRRRFTGGELKDGGKTAGSVRAVPLRQRVVDALDAMATPLRADAPLFTAPRGGYVDIERFRFAEWTPALKAAGLAHRRVYDCRHTFATWAIESRQVPLPELAAIMGTSVRELEDTYFRWLERTDERLRAAFDAYDEAQLAV